MQQAKTHAEDGGRRFIVLEDSREIHLIKFHQYTPDPLAGDGGLSTSDMNRKRIEGNVQWGSSLEWGDAYLIEPKERLLPVSFPSGQPATQLPPVTCFGCFWSMRPARDRNADGSGLAVLWYQNEFAFPIDPDVLEQIRNVDWAKHAWDAEI